MQFGVLEYYMHLEKRDWMESVQRIHPETTMDDNSNFNLGGVEIDMENYHPETFKYEMTDDSSAQQPIEVHNVEVTDVSQAHTAYNYQYRCRGCDYSLSCSSRT